MTTPVKRQGCESIDCKQDTAKHKRFKDIKSGIIPKLREVVNVKGLNIEDVIKKFDMDDDLDINHDVISEISKKRVIKEPKGGRCYFINGNIVTIKQHSKDKNFIYESRNFIDGTIFSLSLIDIFKVFHGEHHGKAMTILVEYFGYRTKEEERKEGLLKRYKKNIKKTSDEKETIWKKEYINLDKVGKETFSTFIELNKHASNNVHKSIHENHVFFASASYICELLGKSRRTVAYHINMLALLGFVKVVKNEDVPEDEMKRAKLERDNKKVAYTVKFLIIEELTDEIVKQANEMAKEIMNKGLNLKMTKEDVENAFGNKGVLKVYGSNGRMIDYMTKKSEEAREDLKKEDMNNAMKQKAEDNSLIEQETEIVL